MVIATCLTGGLAGVSVAGVPVSASGAEPVASTPAGTDTRAIRNHLFAPDSFWYQPLPASTPTDPLSAQMVRDLYRAGETQFGSPGHPNVGVNTYDYSPPIYVATNTDPIVKFGWEDCLGLENDSGLIANQLTGLRVPAGALGAAGSDSEMVVYNRDDDTYTEVWRVKSTGTNAYSACWGGSIRNASTSPGIFPVPFSATATGLPFGGGIIRAAELASGNIDHVVGIGIPFSQLKPAISWPANRGDGQNPLGMVVPAQGQMLRLPASLNLDAMSLSPTARAIAKAVQKYGAVVWDTAGAISFRAENPQALAVDPYPGIYRGRWPQGEMEGDPARGEVAFPLDKLEVLPFNWRTPANSADGALTTSPSPVVLRQSTAASATTVASGSWDARGKRFTASSFTKRMAGKAIANTQDDALYWTAANGVKSFRAAIPTPGTYCVTIYAAEDRYTTAGKRVFSVTAESLPFVSNLDLAKATGGLRRAYQASAYVGVTDGSLDLSFAATVGVPIVSAIEVAAVTTS